MMIDNKGSHIFGTSQNFICKILIKLCDVNFFDQAAISGKSQKSFANYCNCVMYEMGW